MHRILVDERRWIAPAPFLHALNFCMLLPGPEAMQLATYVGWRLHGTAGGLAAGLLFVLPGALVVLRLASLTLFTAKLPWSRPPFSASRRRFWSSSSRRCCVSPGAPCAVPTMSPSPPRPSPPFSSSPRPSRSSSPPRRCWVGCCADRAHSPATPCEPSTDSAIADGQDCGSVAGDLDRAPAGHGGPVRPRPCHHRHRAVLFQTGDRHIRRAPIRCSLIWPSRRSRPMAG